MSQLNLSNSANSAALAAYLANQQQASTVTPVNVSVPSATTLPGASSLSALQSPVLNQAASGPNAATSNPFQALGTGATQQAQVQAVSQQPSPQVTTSIPTTPQAFQAQAAQTVQAIQAPIAQAPVGQVVALPAPQVAGVPYASSIQVQPTSAGGAVPLQTQPVASASTQLATSTNTALPVVTQSAQQLLIPAQANPSMPAPTGPALVAQVPAPNATASLQLVPHVIASVPSMPPMIAPPEALAPWLYFPPPHGQLPTVLPAVQTQNTAPYAVQLPASQTLTQQAQTPQQSAPQPQQTSPQPTPPPNPAANPLQQQPATPASPEKAPPPQHKFNNSIVMSLNARLNDPDWEKRANAASDFFMILEADPALGRDPQYKPYVDAFMVKILRDPSSIVRQPAIMAIETESYTTPSPEVIQELQALQESGEGLLGLESQSIDDALMQLQRLGALAPPPPQLNPAMTPYGSPPMFASPYGMPYAPPPPPAKKSWNPFKRWRQSKLDRMRLPANQPMMPPTISGSDSLNSFSMPGLSTPPLAASQALGQGPIGASLLSPDMTPGLSGLGPMEGSIGANQAALSNPVPNDFATLGGAATQSSATAQPASAGQAGMSLDEGGLPYINPSAMEALGLPASLSGSDLSTPTPGTTAPSSMAAPAANPVMPSGPATPLAPQAHSQVPAPAFNTAA